MKLLTLNVHAWQEDNQMEKINKLAKVIHDKRYDVVALQEVSQHRDCALESGLLREDNYGLLLKKRLESLGSDDYELLWDMSHYGYGVYEEGIALLVRHPVQQKRSFFITTSTSMDVWKSRKIVGADLLVDDHPLAVYSCHLGWWGDEDEPYESQVSRLIDEAGKHKQFMLLGDFNSPDDKTNEGYTCLLAQGLYDTHPTAEHKSGHATIQGDIAGWNGNRDGLKIDYVFSNWKSNVKKSAVIFDGDHHPIISDHFGVEIELDLERK